MCKFFSDREPEQYTCNDRVAEFDSKNLHKLTYIMSKCMKKTLN